jgi:hypothetical protein
MVTGFGVRGERIEAGLRTSGRGWVGAGWSSDCSVATRCCDCVALDSVVPVDAGRSARMSPPPRGAHALSVSRGEKKRGRRKKKKTGAKMILCRFSLSFKV